MSPPSTGRPAAAAEEIKNPRKTIPKSIIMALALSTVVYILVGVVTVGIIPYNELAASASPLADAVDYGIHLHWLKIFVSFAAILATTSVLLTTLIGVSRVSFAMARDKSLPKIFTRIHKKFGTPYGAILVTGIVAAILPFFGSLKEIANVTNFGSLFVYAMVNLSGLLLIWSEKKKKGTIESSKGHWLKKSVFFAVPFLGMLSCIGLMFFLNVSAWTIGLAWILLGVIYYLARRG